MYFSRKSIGIGLATRRRPRESVTGKNKEEQKMKRVVVLLAAGFLVLAAAMLPTTRASAQQEVVTEDTLAQKIESAKTTADHEAIAAFYDKEASDSEAKSKFHHSLHKTYESFKMKPVDMWNHCDEMGNYYEGIAKQARQLAAAHRATGKKAGEQ
jgi:hypothetical protein